MRFEFATATRILFGPGTLSEVAPLAKATHALVVTGRNVERAAPLFARLSAASVSHDTFAVHGEPTLSLVEDGARRLRENRAGMVIAIGGGSVLDAGKAIAALATNPGAALDYLEVIGNAKPLVQPPVPLIAIPTTAGTGTEVTRNAVLTSPEHRVKASLRSPLLLPKLAVIDPELTLGLPPGLTATTGLDALTQLIEPFVSCRANPLVDGICREGLGRVARSLRHAWDEPSNLAAREDMALASLLSGLALANAGLGSVHGFAAAIGGMFSAPHGAVCAALLPHAMDVNVRALRQRQPQAEALVRYAEIARLLTGRSDASLTDGLSWVQSLCADLRSPRLRVYGLTSADTAAVCDKAGQSSSMKGNPLPLTPAELHEVLERSL
jgi:alcohol dehydrogenase class IV